MVRPSHPAKWTSEGVDPEISEEAEESEMCGVIQVSKGDLPPPPCLQAKLQPQGHPGPFIQPETMDQNSKLNLVLEKIGDMLGALMPYVMGKP